MLLHLDWGWYGKLEDVMLLFFMLFMFGYAPIGLLQSVPGTLLDYFVHEEICPAAWG